MAFVKPITLRVSYWKVRSTIWTERTSWKELRRLSWVRSAKLPTRKNRQRLRKLSKFRLIPLLRSYLF